MEHSYRLQTIRGGGGGNITVDDELSGESENPVQNKVITKRINKALIPVEIYYGYTYNIFHYSNPRNGVFLIYGIQNGSLNPYLASVGNIESGFSIKYITGSSNAFKCEKISDTQIRVTNDLNRKAWIMGFVPFSMYVEE